MPAFDAKLPITHETVRALGSRSDAEALKALAATAAVDDQFLRRTAVEVIGRHPQGHELRACILSALGDPSEYVVRTACEVVEHWRLLEAHDLVLLLLASASSATRQGAIRTLGSIWVDTDFPLVFSIYTKDSDIDVRRGAAWVLRRQATSATWRTLFDAFCVDELARHRQWACELAERFSGPEILPLLSSLLRDRDGHVRNAAARATSILSDRSGG
jgi:HEAT repeat protein